MPFKVRMTATMVLDFGLCWIIEKVTKHLFGDFRPKDIAERRPDQIKAEEERKRREAEEKRLELEAGTSAGQ